MEGKWIGLGLALVMLNLFALAISSTYHECWLRRIQSFADGSLELEFLTILTGAER